MSKARTVPGENLSSRLTARGGARARIGAQRSFFQRLGVSDPYGEDPEVDEMNKNGLFSYISASNYYRELRSQRLRMMWRIGSVRHRSVAGERLRAAGPAFTAPRVLAGASLPDMGSFVLLDQDATPEAEPEFGGTRQRSVDNRRVRAAGRAAERSVGRPDAELAQALAQIETLLQGSRREGLRAAVREIPAMAPERRVEAVREVIRTIERTPVASAPQAAPQRVLAPSAPAPAGRASVARAAERTESPIARRAQVVADRPMAVAADRTRTVEGVERRARPVVEQGASGLQPVLRSSPSVRAASDAFIERVASRPAAIERLSREVYAAADGGVIHTRTPRDLLPPSARVALQGREPVAFAEPEAEARAPRRAIPETRTGSRRTRAIEQTPERVDLTPRPVAGTAAETPRDLRPGREDAAAPIAGPARRSRAGQVPAHQSPSVLRDRHIEARDVRPTARIAQTLAAQTLVQPEASARGLTAGGRSPEASVAHRSISTPVPSAGLPRVVARSAAGRSSADVTAPLASSSTSWLSDVLHPERKVERARRAATPTQRSLAVAPELPVLEGPTQASGLRAAAQGGPTAAPIGSTVRDRTVEAGQPRTLRAARNLPEPELALPTRSKVASTEALRPTLRAATRSIPDPDRIAGSPARSPIRVRSLEPAPSPMTLSRPEGATDSAITPRRAATVAEPVSMAASPAAAAERPAVRASRRLERPSATEQAVAPLLERRVLGADTTTPSMQRPPVGRSLVAPAVVDLIAASDRPDEVAAAARIAPTRSASRGTELPSGRPSTASEPAEVVASATRRLERGRAEESELPVVDRASRAISEGLPTVLAAVSRLEGAEEASETPAFSRARAEVQAPATRRALHRAAEPEETTERYRAPLSAMPTSFVHAVAAQRALDSDESTTGPAPEGRADRPSTRAVARSVRTARLDGQDRALLAHSPTEYLDVAAQGESLSRSPVRRRFGAAPSEDATVLRPGRAGSDPEETSTLARRAASAVAANRSPIGRRDQKLDLASGGDVALRAGPARRPRPVLPVGQVVAADRQVELDSPAGAVATRRRELPELSSTLRQVAASFRAAERDSVQVVSVDAARRSVAPASSRAPTITAYLEQDDEGRVVQARASRTSGPGAGETVVLDRDALGLASESAAVERALARTDASEADVGGLGNVFARSALGSAIAPIATVLTRPATAWAEDRGAAAIDAPIESAAQALASPARRATQRWNRPIPEGPVLAVPSREQDDEPHRLTGPTSRRWRGDRPEATGIAGLAEVEHDDEAPTGRRAGRPHSSNTWTELAHRREDGPVGSVASRRRRLDDEDAPGWVRRAVEDPVDRPEREELGSRVRAGGGLLTALARAGDPEEVIRVIMERSHMASALARELPGDAGALIQQIATEAPGVDLAAPDRGRASRGETVAASTSKRGRATSLLESQTPRSRGMRGRSTRTETSEGHEGVGASSVMKLASKLKKLIHLAEHDRRLDDARSQVRMAEESASARTEAGQGKSGGQALEEDNMHLERLREEILREVQAQIEMNKQRSSGDPNVGW